jgi:hypothetical protein
VIATRATTRTMSKTIEPMINLGKMLAFVMLVVVESGFGIIKNEFEGIDMSSGI